MKVKYLIFILVSFFSSFNAFGQRIVHELESNTDSNGALLGDSLEDKEKKFVVPTEVHAWVVDDIFGNEKPIYVDTLHHAYQNNSLSEGMYGEYNTLGNLGSPRINRIFMQREKSNDFIFMDPFDQFLVPTSKFRHYNTKSPYMNVSYNLCGNKTTGYDNLKVIYTQNIGKDVNFGGSYTYMYGQGFYNSQNTGFMNASAWASYRGDRYNLHFYYQNNYMKMAENGGITNEEYITHPEKQTISYAEKDIPTNLDDTWNRQMHNIFFLTHHYNVGFERAEGDSTNRVITFVPVMKFFHTMKVNDLTRNYRSYLRDSDYYSYRYLRNDTINDYTSNFSIRNNVGLALCEGFQKWVAFGLNAYIGHEYRHFSLPDTLDRASYPNQRTSKSIYDENYIILGGQMIRTMGSFVKYNVDAEYVLYGKNSSGDVLGQFSVSGHGELNIPFLKDTLQISANAYIKNENPSFYFRHFHSTFAWWDNEKSIKKERRQRIQAIISYPKTKTVITGGIENISNYSYFANDGITINNKVTNNPVALQCPNDIRVFSVTLDQNVVLGPFNWETNVTYQHSSDDEVLPLPKISAYTNMYLKFRIAKVLKTEFGADMKYFTSYYTPDYSPIIGQFTTQNPTTRTKYGNHPLLSAYANFDLKRLRFYVQYYHFNAGTARAFWGPGYPMNPTGIHFGLSWNFYD